MRKKGIRHTWRKLIRYSNPKSDQAFKKAYPVRHKVLMLCGVMAFILPSLLYTVFTIYVYPAPNSVWMLLGLYGSFFVGVGLFNIVAIGFRQYLGLAFTLLWTGIGGIMVGVSVIILYNNEHYYLWNSPMAIHYLIGAFPFFLGTYYYYFREKIT